MAKGRIEQEIALTVTGLDDVKEIDKKIESLTKKKAKIELEADTTGAAKKVDKINEQIDALTERKRKLTLEADTGTAERDLQAIFALTDKLGATSASIVLKDNAKTIEGEIADLVIKLDTLDANDPDIKVTMDQINALETQLGQVDAKLREVGERPIDIQTGNTRKNLDDIGKSADSSKSVLANMVGNATQDLGALGGIAGSAGVAIGQIGEYAADALAGTDSLGQVLSNFGKVIGPIAAISVGIGLVTKVIGDIQKRNEEIARSSKAIAEGIADDFVTLADSMGKIDTGDFAERLSANFIKTQDTAGRTLQALDDLGIGADKLGATMIALDKSSRLEVLSNIVKTSKNFVGATDAMADSLALAVVNSEDYNRILKSMETEQGAAGKTFVQTNETMVRALEQLDDAAEDFSVDQVISDTSDALLNAAGGVEAFAQATNELGPAASKIDVLSRAIEILDQNTRVAAATETVHKAQIEGVQEAFAGAEERAKAAAEAEVEAAKEAADAQAELLESLNATNDALDESAVAADGFQSALDKIDAGSQLDFSLMAIDTVKSFDDIKGALEEAQKAGVDWSKVDLTPESVGELKGITPELQAVTEAVHGMRESIQAELTAAFDTGGIEGYRDKAAFFAAEIGGQFTQSFKDAGASTKEAEEKTQELLRALGLLPEQVEIQIKLTEAEAARKTLEIFASDIDNLPTDVRTEIKTLWARGETVEALNRLDQYMREHGLPPIDIESILHPPPKPPPDFVEQPDDVEIKTSLGPPEQQSADAAVALWVATVQQQEARAKLDADPKDAQAAVDLWVATTRAREAKAKLDADALKAGRVVDGWEASANATSGTAKLYANAAPAQSTTDGWEANANATRANATVGATATPAYGTLDGWEAAANRTRATAVVTAQANTGQASRDLDTLTQQQRIAKITVQVVKGLFANGGTVGPNGGIAGEAGPEFVNGQLVTGPTPVGPGARVTSVRRTRAILSRSAARSTSAVAPVVSSIPLVVNVNAAVIGSRYEVAKAVGQGTRDLRRLIGNRGTAA